MNAEQQVDDDDDPIAAITKSDATARWNLILVDIMSSIRGLVVVEDRYNRGVNASLTVDGYEVMDTMRERKQRNPSFHFRCRLDFLGAGEILVCPHVRQGTYASPLGSNL